MTPVFQFIKNGMNYGGTKKRRCKQKISNRTKHRIVLEVSNNMTSCPKVRHKMNINISRKAVRKVLIFSEHMKYEKINKIQSLS